MKYLKLVNIPLEIFADPKYGKPTGGSRVCFEEIGVNKTAVKLLAIQYTEYSSRNHVSYIPISDENKFDSHQSNMDEDLELYKSLDPSKTFSIEKIEDDREVWLANRDTERNLFKQNV